MPIQVACACGKKLSVKEELAGRRVKCPACQQAISVPKPKAQAASPDDEWDWDDSEEDDFDEERPTASKRSSGNGKKSASRGPASKKGKSKGKGSSGSSGGLVIGLSVGGGLLVIALLAWMLWPAKPGADVVVAPDENTVGNPAAINGTATSTTNTAAVTPGSQPNASAANPVAAASGDATKPAGTTNPSAPVATGTVALEGDLKLLQGAWYVSDLSVDAVEPTPAGMIASMKQMTWTFKDDILSASTPAGLSASSVRLDPSQSPKAIDLTQLEGTAAGKIARAVYSVEGDTLKLCVTKDETVRPKEMKPDKTLGQMVMTLKKGSPPASSNPAAVASGAQFDLKAWQQASGKLKVLKVFSIMDRCDPNNSSFPDGLTHFAVIDPPATADGSISAELWAVISSVSHVAVRTQSISDATVKQLAQHPGLIGLNISGRSTVTAAGIAELKKCPNLRSLFLSGVPVPPELLNAITQLGELRAFGIHDAPVSSEMVSSIVKLDKLESLSLQNAGTTDDDVAQIAKFTKLRSLLLNKSKVTDKGLSSLKSLTGLMTLDVRGLSLSPQALADFEAAVPKCKVFK